MDDNEEIIRDKVRQEFDRRILLHGNENAVLDASPTPASIHQNRLRHYVTSRSLYRFLKPSSKDNILDSGCGMGRLTLYIAPYVKYIAGVDVSGEMIKAAINKSKSKHNIEYFVHNTKTLDFPEQTFDKIFTVWVLQHISNNELSGLGIEFSKVLKNGGKLVILEQIANEQRVYSQIHIQRTVEAYCDIFKPAGLKMIKAEPVFRMPSYAMSLWNRFHLLTLLGACPFSIIERMTIRRKMDMADYFTYAMIFEKQN